MDQRTKLTKQLIQNSFFELLSKKNLNQITVTELCALSEINRGTFYKYYQDIYDLKNKIYNEYFEKITDTFKKSGITANAYEILYDLLSTVKNNKFISYLILDSELLNNPSVLKVVNFAYEKKLNECKKINPNLDEKQFELLFYYICSGNISTIRKWVKQDFPENIEFLCKTLEKFNNSLFENFCR